MVPSPATASKLAAATDVASQQVTTIPIRLEIISDTICPFCYIGYKKMLVAIEQAEAEKLPVSFSIQFKPFILDPTLPVNEPVSKKDRYNAKFGAQAPAIMAAMTERGKQWGINFSYGGDLRSTFLSHRLSEKASREGGEGLQRSLMELLFFGYFEQERDIGDIDFLTLTAVKAGVFDTTQEARQFLESDDLKGEVCTNIRKAQTMGVSGVPFTIINHKYAVSGAQEPEAFLQIFRKISTGLCPCEKDDRAVTTPGVAYAPPKDTAFECPFGTNKVKINMQNQTCTN